MLSGRSPRWLCWVCWALLASGCTSPVQEQTDNTVCALTSHLMDPEPLQLAPLPRIEPPSQSLPSVEAPGTTASKADLRIMQTSAQLPWTTVDKQPRLEERLKIPPELPGANAPLPRFPEDRPENKPERDRIVRELFPPLPELGADPQPLPGPEGHPFTLADLQRLAMSNSPLIRQAAADIEGAKGAARQAGAYPNPIIGYEADTAGTGGTAGFQGMFFDQTIKTGGKLKVGRAAALMDLRNTELALQRAQVDVATQVRSNYFQVLVAQENMKVSRALAKVTDEAFAIQLLQFEKGGIAAAYEPMLLRSYAFQARGALNAARNSYLANWTQLAAALGQPHRPPTELAGRVDMPVPLYDWDQALAQVLNRHTDVLTAQATEKKARYNLLLAQLTPVPDVNLHLVVQKDYTAPPNTIVSTVQLGVPVPVWDQNEGAIRQSQGQLLRAVEEAHRVRDDLTSRLADAFQRYRSNLVLLDYYRMQILPDNVRYYRSLYQRHGQDLGVQFSDVIVAQQSLGTAVAGYVTALGATWQAVTDMAALLQTDDLFQMGTERCPEPVPDLEHLLTLPCCHPCSPLPDPGLKGARFGWPDSGISLPVMQNQRAAGEAASTLVSGAGNGPIRPAEEEVPEFRLPLPGEPLPSPAAKWRMPPMLPPVTDEP